MTDKLKKKPATRRDRDDARRLQKAGTHGDTVLAHINPQERDLLDLLADGLLDGGGRNVRTGLLSFGMSDGESGRGDDSNPGGVGGGPAGGNTGGGIGGNTEGGLGGLGGGYDGSTVDGFGGYSSGARSGIGYGWRGNINNKPSIANASLAQLESIAKQINDDIDTNYGGMFGTDFTSRTDGWASPDTFGRFFQELWAGPAYNTPGRWSAPNALGPGIMGTFATQLVSGPMFGGTMRAGAAAGRAQSQASRDATEAGFGAMSAHNSGGNQGGHSVQDMDAAAGATLGGAAPAGMASGAQTAERFGGTVPGVAMAPGYTVNEAGQVVPTGGGRNTLTGLPTPVENLLADYIWRGRQGGGWGW